VHQSGGFSKNVAGEFSSERGKCTATFLSPE
jgi:hypothetical protein